MRHYLWYRTDGELGNAETRTHGWPDSADPRDPKTTDPTAQWLRTRRPETEPSFAGFAAYDCVCDRSVGSCLCPYGVLLTHYFDGVRLVEKPMLAVEVSGQQVTAGEALDLTPGVEAQCVFKAQVPDGHVLTVRSAMLPFKLIEDEKAISFTAGVSEPVTIVVPPQGVTGGIVGKTKYVRHFCVMIRGWE